MGDSIDCILYMFMRPGEPLCVPKGDEKVIFDIPNEYLPERYQLMGDMIMKEFRTGNERIIPINRIDCTDCDIPMKLGRGEQFSVFIPEHQKMAGKLIEIFTGKKSFEDLLSVAAYCRDRVNSQMFIYALSVAILHRVDTKHLSLPPLSGVFPHFFIDNVTLTQAKEEASVLPAKIRPRIVIKKDHTASDFEIEHRIAYFREDLGINLHHWHWHLVYPFDGPKEYVDKDRRGELFYYMHQQIIARYNFERLSNHLIRVKSLSNWREPVPEGYFPKLGVDSITKPYPGRQSGAFLKDIDRSDGQIELHDLEHARDRILEAIHRREVTDKDGKTIPLTEFEGINVLGNIVEASILSPNGTLYGDIHNSGHTLIASCHDPDNRHLEGVGVMGNNATAMRDPVFYRLHSFIDDIFQEYKNLLPPYAKDKLDYKEMEVSEVKVIIKDEATDSFYTHWEESDVDIAGGLDFASAGAIMVRFTHLQHVPFSYKIKVINNSNTEKIGTIRIFMAPRHDESGKALALEKQRSLMIELDKFTWVFTHGDNHVTRRSDESSVTIPFEQTFPKLGGNLSTHDKAKEGRNFCGCGWPQHMLIPKGTEKGLEVDLFVMVSDFADDKVDQGTETRCCDAASFCGLKDKKYPDARSMGYPFDRPIQDQSSTSDKFHTGNMLVKKMSIRFSDNTQPMSDGHLEKPVTNEV